jgi:hypothetical protein
MTLSRWSAFVCLAALGGFSCGHAGPSSDGPSESQTLQLDDSSNEIVLTNTTGRVMLTGSSFLLEERTGDVWVSADRTLEGISVQPQATRFNSLKLTEIAPGDEKRYSISYVDQLPPGEYRVTVGTGEDDNTSSFEHQHSLRFMR